MSERPASPALSPATQGVDLKRDPRFALHGPTF